MYLKTFFLRNLIKQCKVTTHFAPIVTQKYNYSRNNHSRSRWNVKTNATVALLGSVLIGAATKDKQKSSSDTQTKIIEAGEKRPDLPTFTAEEVSKHDTLQSFWVTYRHGVYDVTSFLPSHPGGEQILNAGGLSIEPFWNVYGMHKTEEIYQLLESYRIGNLHDDDIVDQTDDELWAKEPYRDKRLLIKTAKPFNAEIPPKLQIEHFDTPNELFYVRQHMPVPDIDPATHKLTVIIDGEANGENRVKEFSLQDLEQFPVVTVNAALMCAGNRRSEMNKQVKPVKGLSWTTGAISNATWRGVLLRDVLIHCGVNPDAPENDHLHVILTGADTDATGTQFSTSLPLSAALRRDARVLLATHMNARALPADHGRPLRALVPGAPAVRSVKWLHHGRPLRALVPGAPAVRSVKWLQSIRVSKEESSSHWHKKDYRSFNPSKTWETADFESAPPVYSLPVTSAVCSPEDGDTVRLVDGCIEFKGYAYSGGGAQILRVDVSTDRGETWSEATLSSDKAPPPVHYSWTLWTLKLPVEKNEKEVEIWVKATDSNFNTQPEKFDDIWNIRGILSNAYHKIKVNVKH